MGKAAPLALLKAEKVANQQAETPLAEKEKETREQADTPLAEKAISQQANAVRPVPIGTKRLHGAGAGTSSGSA